MKSFFFSKIIFWRCVCGRNVQRKNHKYIENPEKNQLCLAHPVKIAFFWHSHLFLLFVFGNKWMELSFISILATFYALCNSAWSKDSLLWGIWSCSVLYGVSFLIPLLLCSCKKRLGEDGWVLWTSGFQRVHLNVSFQLLGDITSTVNILFGVSGIGVLSTK